MPCDDGENCFENQMQSESESESTPTSSSSSFSSSSSLRSKRTSYHELAFPPAAHSLDSKPVSAPQKAAAHARQLLSFTQQLILQRKQSSPMRPVRPRTERVRGGCYPSRSK